MKNSNENKLHRDFNAGKISRRGFMRRAAALGIATQAPFFLSAAHAQTT